MSHNFRSHTYNVKNWYAGKKLVTEKSQSVHISVKFVKILLKSDSFDKKMSLSDRVLTDYLG